MAGQTVQLVMRRGARPGRKAPLRGDRFRIGADASCDWVLKDAYVSPVHTVLERRGGTWTAVNQGVNGTLVNGEPIEGARALAAGDMIQVGAETLLELVAGGATRRERTERKAGAPAEAVPLWQRPAVIAGMAVYLLVIVGLFAFLAGLEGRRDAGLASADVDRAIEGTRAFLAGPALAADGGPETPLDPDADLSHDFHALVAMARAGRDADAEALRERILGRLETEFFQAWQYEQRQEWAAATRRYERVLATVPTLRAPAARLATARIRVLRARGTP